MIKRNVKYIPNYAFQLKRYWKIQYVHTYETQL